MALNLELTEEQQLLFDTFDRFFANESTTELVRSVEPLGHSPDLWGKLVGLGAPAIRVADSRGGANLSLRDMCIVSERAGRYLAPAPVVEAGMAARILSQCAQNGNQDSSKVLERLLSGDVIVSIALHSIEFSSDQLVPYGAVANAVIAFEADELFLCQPNDTDLERKANLGAHPLAKWNLARCKKISIGKGDKAAHTFQTARAEWKLLVAAQLTGICGRALEYASEYGNERTAFGVPIGSFQGLSHPLADSASILDGARLLIDYAIWDCQCSDKNASAHIDLAYWCATEAASQVLPQCLHLFGGYGVSEEHDIQLYVRRGVALTNFLGDRQKELTSAADKLWCNRDSVAPETVDSGLDFSLGKAPENIRNKVDIFFAENMTPELESFRVHSFDGFHPEIYKNLGQANLLFPNWPKRYGGLDATPSEVYALTEAFYDNRWTLNPQLMCQIVGETVLAFGSEAVKDEVMPRVVSGDALICLGLTEPHCGSDVFAAKTRAVKQGDKWVINGQKVFTSGAHIASYVLLLTETDPDSPKHAGKTLFLVPMDAPGVEVQRLDTIADERTNITFYTDVEVSDDYRIGDVDGGAKVMGFLLGKEQGGSPYGFEFKFLIEQAVKWALETERDGARAFDDPLVRLRLAKGYADYKIFELMYLRIVHNTEKNMIQRHHASMLKVFVTEACKRHGAEFMNMAAPDTLFSDIEELSYLQGVWRRSLATCIYAGTSQVHRSVVAEAGLGLPRSR